MNPKGKFLWSQNYQHALLFLNKQLLCQFLVCFLETKIDKHFALKKNKLKWTNFALAYQPYPQKNPVAFFKTDFSKLQKKKNSDTNISESSRVDNTDTFSTFEKCLIRKKSFIWKDRFWKLTLSQELLSSSAPTRVFLGNTIYWQI